MTLTQRQLDERRRLQNRAEILDIDLSYRSSVYADAYSLILQLRSVINELPDTHPVYQQAFDLIDKWNLKDEANWQLYNEKRQKTRSAHRQKAKRQRAAIEPAGGAEDGEGL